jgi:hypothetical protein
MNPKHWFLLFGALLWFAVVYWFAANGAFVSAPDGRPTAIGAAFATPLLLFLAGIVLVPAWRQIVTSIPPVFLISLNGWRFVGLGFLMGNLEGLLPGGFAWPAGLGDIAMAVTAPWVAAHVAADDKFRFSTAFLVWNLFGIADFLDAVLLGTIYNTPLMQRLPFALIPAFFVPLLAMGHITLLAQRSARRTG